jgi:uncharacterized membrane protein
MIKKFCIIFLWVIHVSGIIGIYLGHDDFFFPKSGGTILYILLLLVLWFPVKEIKSWLLFVGCAATGIVAEWIGVHTGKLFGEYHYLDNMGYDLDGVPYLIGVNWAVLVFITHSMAQVVFKSKYLVATAGAGLMVFIDYFLEQMCEYAGFWTFDNGAGFYNYLCWFIIAWFLHLAAFEVKLKGDPKIAAHLYIVQLIFALSIWIIISI